MENNSIWDEIDPYGEENWGDKEEPEIMIIDYSYSGTSGTSEIAVPDRVNGIVVKSKLVRNRLPKERKVKVKFYNYNKFNLFKIRKYC
jgi:hypothetical protein